MHFIDICYTVSAKNEKSETEAIKNGEAKKNRHKI